MISSLSSHSKKLISTIIFIKSSFFSQPYHTLRSKRPTKKSLHKRPIPFLSHLKEIDDPDEAISLFDEYLERGFKHDYPSYSSLLYKLAQAHKFDEVKTLLVHIKNCNIYCKEALFIALMKHYGKSQMIKEAIQLFHEISSFNCVKTLQSFNTILNILVDNGFLQDANVLFMSKKKFRLNAVPFNIMIKGWLERNEWEQACLVFNQMLEREVDPTVVTYNSLIGYLCKKSDLEKAKKLFDDMVKKGKHPNAVTYSLLMEGFCSIGNHEQAKKVMFDMEYKGCKVQLVNYGVLMNDLAKRGEFEEAQNLLLEMKKRRIKPDTAIYNMLINYTCKEERANEAYKILVDMQVKGCEPNAATYRTMVDGFCNVGEFDKGLKVLNAMLVSNHCPRHQTFCRLVEGLVKCRKLDEACFVLEEMKKRNIRFDYESWEILVSDSCCGDRGDANDLLADLVI